MITFSYFISVIIFTFIRPYLQTFSTCYICCLFFRSNVNAFQNFRKYWSPSQILDETSQSYQDWPKFKKNKSFTTAPWINYIFSYIFNFIISLTELRMYGRRIVHWILIVYRHCDDLVSEVKKILLNSIYFYFTRKLNVFHSEIFSGEISCLELSLTQIVVIVRFLRFPKRKNNILCGYYFVLWIFRIL